MDTPFIQPRPGPGYAHGLPPAAVPADADVLGLPLADRFEPGPDRAFYAAILAFEMRNSAGENDRGEGIPCDPKPSPGFVYAASYAGDTKHIKVGQSRTFPTRRLDQLTARTAAPSRLTLLFALETPFRRSTEKSAHDALVPHHSKGEWFSLTADALLETMFGLVVTHAERRYEWRLWTTPCFLGMCSAASVRALCAAGLGAEPAADDPAPGLKPSVAA